MILTLSFHKLVQCVRNRLACENTVFSIPLIKPEKFATYLVNTSVHYQIKRLVSTGLALDFLKSDCNKTLESQAYHYRSFTTQPFPSQ